MARHPEINQFRVLMYRPLEVNEKDGELLDTQMSKDSGVDFHGRYSLKKKKKVWFNLRAHLWGRDSRMMTAAPIRMKGLVIFPSPMRALREVFSIRSPRPSVLRRVNGCFFLAPSRRVKRGRGDELFSNKVPNSAHRRMLPFLKTTTAHCGFWEAVECRAIWS